LRVFLDSNVLIAAAISDGECRRLLHRILRQHQAVLSEEALAETSRKLSGKFHQDKAVVALYANKLRNLAEVLPAQVAPARVSRDPKDDWVLAAALAGRCHCILSGDADLWALARHKKVAILRPRDFLAFEAGCFRRRKSS